jgi:hypothetical protein
MSMAQGCYWPLFRYVVRDVFIHRPGQRSTSTWQQHWPGCGRGHGNSGALVTRLAEFSCGWPPAGGPVGLSSMVRVPVSSPSDFGPQSRDFQQLHPCRRRDHRGMKAWKGHGRMLKNGKLFRVLANGVRRPDCGERETGPCHAHCFGPPGSSLTFL